MSDQHYVVIYQPASDSIVLVNDGQGWSLPSLASLRPADVIGAMADQFGLPTLLLGCIYDAAADNDMNGDYQILAVEDRSSPATQPKNGMRMSAASLVDLPLPAAQLQRIGGGLNQLRPAVERPSAIPWYRIGWHASAECWICAQLAAHGHSQHVEIEQLHVRPWSCILRVRTEQIQLYFKASGPSTTYEAALTAALHARYPAQTPAIIAIDKTCGWMLMRDIGRTLGMTMLVDGDPNPAYYEQVLDSYARLQRDASTIKQTLRETGCPDYQLKHLPQLYQRLLEDADSLLIGTPEGLKADEYQTFQGFLPTVEALATQLASLGIPETIHHDDLWCGNLAQVGDNTIFFDWGEAAIGHPFCSLYTLLKQAYHQLGYGNETCDQLRDSYLERWSDFASPARLREGFALAQRIALLYRALSWQRTLADVPSEVRGAYRYEVSAYLRCFVTGQS